MVKEAERIKRSGVEMRKLGEGEGRKSGKEEREYEETKRMETLERVRRGNKRTRITRG